MPSITIAQESPRQPEIIALIADLDALMHALYPAESNHLLDIDTLAGADVRFFVARRDGEALGCGALRVDAAGWGEVKRMFVQPRARGAGIGRRVLEAVESQARAEELSCLRLETGVRNPEARALYRRTGFAERAAFGDYAPDPLSVFMEKSL